MLTSQMIDKIKVDHDIELPFSLILLNGANEILVTKLSRIPSNILDVTYTIKEMQNLKLILQTSEDIEVKIVWNYILNYEKDESIKEITLSRDISEHILFSYSEEGDNEYPWRCGLYHFEVIYDGQRYLGGFKVVPKNLDEDQLSYIIHDIIAVFGKRKMYKTAEKFVATCQHLFTSFLLT